MKFRILFALAVVGLFTAEASAFGRRHRGCGTCPQQQFVQQPQVVYNGGCQTCVGQPWTPVRSTVNAVSPVTVFPNCTNGRCTLPQHGVVPASTSGPQIVPAPNR
jgi:hypothetical protein